MKPGSSDTGALFSALTAWLLPRPWLRRLWPVLIGLVLLACPAAAQDRPETGEPVPPVAAPRGTVPVATDARLGGDAKRTRFVMAVDREVPFRVFALADPYRVIIDLPEIHFRLPRGAGSSAQGLVNAYRYGLIAVGKSRIVLDAASPVLIERAFVLSPENGEPARLAIDLVATDRATFLAEQDRLSNPRPPASPREEGAAAGTGPGARKVVVVIDPGHGGGDPGAVARDGTREKDVVLGFARTLREDLRKRGHYRVMMTRNDDVFLPLQERVEFARRNGASLFVSIHADSLHDRSVRGATVYTLSERASDHEAAALASKENRADIISGLDLVDEPDEVTDILIDLAQRETKNFSVRFAKQLVSAMSGNLQLNHNPHRFAGFRVLKAPDVPSVLVELGYMSNSRDVKEMVSKAWRKRAASTIGEALDAYFDTRFARTGN
jgi:N-acetylmuramoyl-L-alanine amidase